jgi:hypothetical protein
MGKTATSSETFSIISQVYRNSGYTVQNLLKKEIPICLLFPFLSSSFRMVVDSLSTQEVQHDCDFHSREHNFDKNNAIKT